MLCSRELIMGNLPQGEIIIFISCLSHQEDLLQGTGAFSVESLTSQSNWKQFKDILRDQSQSWEIMMWGVCEVFGQTSQGKLLGNLAR